MKRSFIIYLFVLGTFLTFSLSLYAQDLPRIIQPSPEASALFRFQDYPMDYSTGLPQINIPIYEIKSGDLTVPISISYHASGRRVYDQDGPIATGWSLNAGGIISRTVYGAVDFGTSAGTFKFPYPFNTTNLSNSTSLPYLENIMHYNDNPDDANPGTWTDGEYDIFSYSFGDCGGKFFFKDNNNVKTAALLPYKPYVITPVYDATGLTKINILDDKGTLYEFTGEETTLQSQSAIETVPATTGYVLTKITSADKSQIITFIYTAFLQTRKTISQAVLFNDDEVHLPGAPNNFVTEGPTSTETTSESPYQVARLTEIDFKQGKVLFNLVSGSDKVDNIKITDNNNTVIKTINLSRSYLNNLSEIGYFTNKLDNIVFNDNTGTATQTYSFQYYPNPSVPGQQDNAILNVRYRDWWGFYNASGVNDMVPYYSNLNRIAFNGVNNQNDLNIGNASANREPNLQGLEAGVLKKVVYPTGGSTEFVYEINKYWSYTISQIKNGPGLRVSQIKTDDNNGVVSYKTYTYGESESGYGTLDMEPDITNMAFETINNHYATNSDNLDYYYRSRVFNSDFITSISELGERPVIYTTVTEYDGTTTNNIGKTVYTYDYNGWAAGGMPGFENLTIAKKQIGYFNYWNNPSLLSQRVYKNIPVNNIPNYTLKKQLINDYDATTTERVNGLHVQRVHNLSSVVNSTNDRVLANPPVYEEPFAANYANPLINIYTYAPYQIPVGYKNLSSATETYFNDDGSSIVNATIYTYNSHQYVSQRSVNASDGQSLNTQITYPFDYTGNTILDQMNSLNMMNYPIEQNQLKNTTPLSGVRTNYYNFGSTNPSIYPQTIDVKKGGGNYETRLRYLGYDSYGNPVSVSKENDVLNSYIWDYNNTYPVAEVKNANASDIAYTSFEADGNGNWTGITANNVVQDINSITGSKYYNLTLAGLPQTGLTTTNTYIVSYWSKGGQYAVTGTSAAGWPKNLQTVTINDVNWVNWEHKVSGVSAITISGTAGIDDLRLYPATAQMNSYTYTPLIGVTSQTDLNNKVTYYEYDAFGRLKLIRDINKNIIKTFSYKYNSSTY
jgi:YD repeat-containing protein